MAGRRITRGGVDRLTSPLFTHLPEPPPTKDIIELRNLPHPVWTENKAKLIARYLQLFTYITKHGSYIDGFAGRQNSRANDGWAAELVLALTPRRMRQMYLCDKGAKQVRGLQSLADGQPTKEKNDAKRDVRVFKGDFNKILPTILEEQKLERAAFCLLDQHTFECQWSTVEALAKHRTSGMKIELFYFLPIGWLNRAMLVSITEKGRAAIDAWWGRPADDWHRLLDMHHYEKAKAFRARFEELGYKYVLPLPIFDSARGNRVMFYMILASDHPDAPKLMWRAYDQAVPDVKGWDQIDWVGGAKPGARKAIKRPKKAPAKVEKRAS